MSRTRRGAKGAGYEYWTARPGNVGGGRYSPNGNKEVKRATHKAERQEGKRDSRAAT
ncbi:hypothetical protein LMG26857_03638 [Achromobacter anxifer]|uniref:hypothetical protein n=1 Tax=Achromobacter anxifer TaxID=1287737 RepID=UPI00155D07CF|nr:hypothetical protein [Achromobacter anxifer]CAB5514579.1 hypothetical protein LMG26857_03638 [Achromobacter anxifer]